MPPRPEKTRENQQPRPPLGAAPLHAGEWLWTTRAGAEMDLVEELALAGVKARSLQEALVASGRPATGVEPAFARQGLAVQALCPPTEDAVVAALHPRLRGPFALHVWVPDTEEENRLSGQAQELRRQLTRRLQADLPEGLLEGGPAAVEAGGQLAQVCLLSRDLAAVGVERARDAHSLAPGGRLRFHVGQRAPSRSAMKLGEALAWLGRGPEPGDVCVDLGAAPGGWTYVLLQRRAHVVAIDPGQLAPSLRHDRHVEHLRMSAFDFAPEIPADWLMCDMAWRPLEVAALLAKWGRKHWAQFLLANIKLPMRKRAEMLSRVKEIIATGGWTGLRARQLYHDRDEVTLSAWRGFGVDARAPDRARRGARTGRAGNG